MHVSVVYFKAYKMTYSLGLDHDLLLILTLERVSKKPESEVLRRIQHPGSSYAFFRKQNAESWCTYWDSVLNTGMVFVSLKF